MMVARTNVVEASLAGLRTAFVDMVPRLVTALLFVVIAYIAIKLVLKVVRSALGRVYAGTELVADLFTTVVGVFLWFAVVLTLLKILGMGEIAASLGTATGFVALGVSYALSEMIADTVAGVYLLRDPDFDPGDEVVVGDVSGVVQDVDLRKTRLAVDGDVVVMGNSSVEEKWTRKGDSDESAGSSVAEAAAEPSGEASTTETDPAIETDPATETDSDEVTNEGKTNDLDEVTDEEPSADGDESPETDRSVEDGSETSG